MLRFSWGGGNIFYDGLTDGGEGAECCILYASGSHCLIPIKLSIQMQSHTKQFLYRW